MKISATGAFLQLLTVLLVGGARAIKIVFSYFLGCITDIADAIADEWENREIDDEIY